MRPSQTLLPLIQRCSELKPYNPAQLELAGDTFIEAISSDSRLAKPGTVFVALSGSQTDGHQYVKTAIEQGASAVVVRLDRLEKLNLPSDLLKQTVVLLTPNTYKALGQLCSSYYADPGHTLKMIGVTGTNGKTTVTHLIETILEQQGKSVGLIGTLGKKSGVKKPLPPAASDAHGYESTGHTTPMAPELQASLAQMLEEEVEYVVMEVSSHALDQYRAYGCDFRVAVLSNITQDHLDYHKTMTQYWRAKALLFEGLTPDNAAGDEGKRSAVINLDSDFSQELLDSCPKGTSLYTYSLKNPQASLYAKDLLYSITGASFTLITPVGQSEVRLKLAGQFSVYNALAALASGIALDIPLADCVKSIESVAGIRGRFEVVSQQPFVIVDYAHTPDGLENILNAARMVTPEGGRLICVFGCGGDRDATKRPKMGRVVETLADVMVITSDNPRSEDPQQIITDIIAGIKRFDAQRMLVNADRKQAIHQAIDKATPEDIIVVAGKGHEDYQILADQTIHFDDKEVVLDYVKKSSGQAVP